MLGAWADLTRAERLEKIRESSCHPTPCRKAAVLPRVQWLKNTFKAKQLYEGIPWESVLEIGCHDGFSTRWLADELEVHSVYGVELSTKAVKWAKEMASTRQNPHKLIYSEADWMFWAEGRTTQTFDCIVLFELVEHLDDAELTRLLTYANTALNPSGMGFITTPHIDGPFGRTNPDPQHINLMTPDDLLEVFRATVSARRAELWTDDAGGLIHLMWIK